MTSAFAVEVDPQLIDRAQCGDREALFEIYTLFEKPAYTLAYRICQCPDQAREVLQDGMLQMVEHVHQYSYQAPFWTWLRKLFVNAALMQLRRQRRQQNLEVLVDTPADEEADRPAMQRDIASAFSRLAPERRAVLWLYAVEGFNHREIAELLGYTPSYSKTQLMRARRQLQTWWGGTDSVKGGDYNDSRQ